MPNPEMFSSLTVRGHRNAVRCALAFFEALNKVRPYFEIDFESFERLALKVGDAKPEDLEPGFFLQSLEDVRRLCDIGNFAIVMHEGKVTAMTPEEFKAWQFDTHSKGFQNANHQTN